MPSATVRLTLVELTGRRSRPLRPEEERDLLRTDLAERQRSLFRRDGGPLDDQLRDIESLRRRLQALDAVAPDAPSGQRPPRPRPRAGEKGPGPDRARK